jgi:hypothetical protein
MAVPCAWRVREKEEEDDWEAAADKDEDDWESSVAEFKTLTVKADGEEEDEWEVAGNNLSSPH